MQQVTRRAAYGLGAAREQHAKRGQMRRVGLDAARIGTGVIQRLPRARRQHDALWVGIEIEQREDFIAARTAHKPQQRLRQIEQADRATAQRL